MLLQLPLTCKRVFLVTQMTSRFRLCVRVNVSDMPTQGTGVLEFTCAKMTSKARLVGFVKLLDVVQQLDVLLDLRAAETALVLSPTAVQVRKMQSQLRQIGECVQALTVSMLTTHCSRDAVDATSP